MRVGETGLVPLGKLVEFETLKTVEPIAPMPTSAWCIYRSMFDARVVGLLGLEPRTPAL